MSNFDINIIEEKLGYVFNDKDLLLRAFTHSSYTNEHKYEHNYERLEFLGDATLNFVMARHLYESYPSYNEGALSKLRAGVVDRNTVASIVDELEFIQFLRTGAGNVFAVTDSVKVKCDLFEAIIGAIVEDNNGDITCASNVILCFFEDKIGCIQVDYKSKLLEYCAKNSVKCSFNVINKQNIDGQPCYIVKLDIEGKQYIGEGRKIKIAEQAAAKKYFLK